jgi:oligopeptide/dipeptide ABC transporter ATP-binding protein
MYLGRIVEEGPTRRGDRGPAPPVHEGAALGRADGATRGTGTDVQILRGETPNPIAVPAGCRFHPRCPIAVDRLPRGRSRAAGRWRVERDHRAACILA